jgi:hypothetical protein
MPAVTAYLRIDDNDFEKVIPLAQTGASITPVNLRLDDGDVAGKIKALEIAAGIPVGQRLTGLMDRKDWAAKLITLQGKINMRTVTISIASPGVVTLATHGWVANQAFKFFTTGALPTGIVAGTTYYVSAVGGPPAGTFQFSATPGGASIVTTGTQSGTQSVYAA